MNKFFRLLCAAGSLWLATTESTGQTSHRTLSRVAVRRDDAAKLRGEVKRIRIESEELEEPRELKVYLPPGHSPKKRYPVIYLFDSFEDDWPPLVEERITSGKMPPMILVGIVPGAKRFQEYVPGADLGTFQAHEKFFIHEVLPWAEKEWGASKERKQRIVSGNSNSGPCALYMSTKYVSLFGHVIAFQVYACPFDDFERDLKKQEKDPTCYKLVVGSEDSWGVEENEKIRQLLSAKEFPVSSSVVEGYTHSRELCRDQLPYCLEAIFANKR